MKIDFAIFSLAFSTFSLVLSICAAIDTVRQRKRKEVRRKMAEMPQFTHELAAEEKEKQERLLRTMPVGVVLIFPKDADPNASPEWPGTWEQVSSLWKRVE